MELAICPQTQAARFRFHPNNIKTSLASPSILLVEENPESQQAHLRLLQLLSCKVEVATSGQEAVLLCLQHSYDLVLIDTQLPDSCGFEISKQIKAHRHPLYIPIIALTPHIHDQQHPAVDELVAKPVTPEKLISILTRWLK